MIGYSVRMVKADQAMNAWIQSELERLAQRRGWDNVPLEDPAFDFSGYVRNVMIKKGFRGLTLEEKASETIQRLLYDIETGGPGPLLRQYDGRVPFDAYFKMAVHNRSLSELRDEGAKRSRIPTRNIAPSKRGDDSSPGISSEVIPGVSAGPDDEYLRQTVDTLLLHLSRQRHGDMLSLMFRLLIPQPYGEGLSQNEVVDYLGREGVVSPTGETRWSPGMVNSYIQKLRRAVEQYAREENLGEGGEGTLQNILTQMSKQKAKKVQDAKSFAEGDVVKGEAIWFKNGDASQEVLVRIVRKSLKNTRIELPDGTQTVVDSRHIVLR